MVTGVVYHAASNTRIVVWDCVLMWTVFDLVVSGFSYYRLCHTSAHFFINKGAHKIETVSKAGSHDPASLQSDQRIQCTKEQGCTSGRMQPRAPSMAQRACSTSMTL